MQRLFPLGAEMYSKRAKCCETKKCVEPRNWICVTSFAKVPLFWFSSEQTFLDQILSCDAALFFGIKTLRNSLMQAVMWWWKWDHQLEFCPQKTCNSLAVGGGGGDTSGGQVYVRWGGMVAVECIGGKQPLHWSCRDSNHVLAQNRKKKIAPLWIASKSCFFLPGRTQVRVLWIKTIWLPELPLAWELLPPVSKVGASSPLHQSEKSLIRHPGLTYKWITSRFWFCSWN